MVPVGWMVAVGARSVEVAGGGMTSVDFEGLTTSIDVLGTVGSAGGGGGGKPMPGVSFFGQ